jgi:hypothetical protein
MEPLQVRGRGVYLQRSAGEYHLDPHSHVSLSGADLQRNFTLVSVNLAWNGFGYEGAVGLKDLLIHNKTLEEIDVTSNRINWQGALIIAGGIRKNDTLQILKVGHMCEYLCIDLTFEHVTTKHRPPIIPQQNASSIWVCNWQFLIRSSATTR